MKITEKKGPSGPQSRIDKMKKPDLMEMLRKNDWNIPKTSKESGVNRQTLVKWINADETIVRKQYTNVGKMGVAKVVTDTYKSISDIAIITNEQITLGMGNVSDYIATTRYLRDRALKRMIALIDSERDINKLSKLTTELSKYLDLEGSKKPVVIPGRPTVSDIQANFQCNEEMLILFAEKLTQFNDIHNEN